MGGDLHVLHRFYFKNLPLLGAWLSDWIGTAANRPSGGYSYQCVDLHGNQLLYLVSNALWLGSGISVTCQEDAKQEICLWTINSNPGKTLFLNNLESGDVVGDKVEIIAITVLLENLKQRYRWNRWASIGNPGSCKRWLECIVSEDENQKLQTGNFLCTLLCLHNNMRLFKLDVL